MGGMRAWSSGGFTLVEMLVVMVVGAILAATVLPKLANVNDARDQAWRDALVSAIRYARDTAVSHRRVVCATFSANGVSLTVTALRTSGSCSAALVGPDGSTSFGVSGNPSSVVAITYSDRTAGTTATQALPLTVYFQPDGHVSTAFSGTTSSANWAWTLTPTGAQAITLEGASGYAY